MRERCHLLLRETRHFPPFYPRPGANISNAVLALPISREVFSRLTGILAGKPDLKDAVDAESLALEALDSVYRDNLLASRLRPSETLAIIGEGL